MDASLKVYEKIRPVLLREVDGDRLLMEMDDAKREMVRVHLVNEVGARILELIDGSRSVRELTGTICKEFEGTPGQVETDVVEFIHKLCSMGQIRLCSSPENR